MLHLTTIAEAQGVKLCTLSALALWLGQFSRPPVTPVMARHLLPEESRIAGNICPNVISA
tara:strand:- start:231 stop:410 length:180 start_codon:yes stop_codon:yes gene_type:complete